MMKLNEQILRMKSMMGIISESTFFQRRVIPSEISKYFFGFAEQVFHDTNSYGQFKYELVLKSLEHIMWQEYNLGWEHLPEQDEIEYVNAVAEIYNDEIKSLYNVLAFKD